MWYPKVVAVFLSLAFLLLAFMANVETAIVVYGPYDAYEQWGPRSQDFIMKFYASETLMCEALEAGDIDIVASPIPKNYYDRWQDPSYNITIVGSGAEWGMYVLDINNNETLPDGSHNPCSDPAFRHAIWHLIDRESIANVIFDGMAVPLWSPIPCAAPDYWKNPACIDAHPFNITEANRILDVAGYVIGPNGIRIDPVTGQEIILKVYGRTDCPELQTIAEHLCTLLPWVYIGYTLYLMDNYYCYVNVIEKKDFQLYPNHWSVGFDPPDILYRLYHSYMYWHPGWCPNYGNYHDDISDALLDSAFYAETMADAIPYVLQWQERYISPEWVPNPTLVCQLIYMAHRKYYSQPPYQGLPFKGIFNWSGRGIGAYNNFWTFMNVYPEGFEAPGNYSIRWGWSYSRAKRVNPIYGSSTWDWAIMNWIYDTLMRTSPFNGIEDKPWVAYQYSIGTWANPDNPQFLKSTYVIFKIRNDVYWHDGTPMTIEDFRWMIGSGPDDLVPLLLSRGFPYPWWYSSVADVHHVDVIDSQTITVYYNVRSYLALHWLINLPLIPKHIWEPIVLTGNPAASFADPYLTGSGPYKFVNYTSPVGANLTRNDNYFRQAPIDMRKTTWTYQGKNYVKINLYNYALEPINVTLTKNERAIAMLIPLPSAFGGGTYPGVWNGYFEVPSLPVTVNITYKYHNKSYTKSEDFANTIREDVNCDKFVNIKDAVLVNGAFGSEPGDLNWDERADIIQDGVVNIKDVVAVNYWYGWPEWPLS
jgi:ABC-type transport system substrate-binding protein